MFTSDTSKTNQKSYFKDCKLSPPCPNRKQLLQFNPYALTTKK